MIAAMQKTLVPAQVLFAAAAIALTVSLGLAFAGWLGHGDRILFSMIQSGLAWCF